MMSSELWGLGIKQNVEKAVADVRKALDATRNPRHPEDVPHTYDDKFAIVELVTRAALTTQLNTLANGFALSQDAIAKLQAERGNQTVTLRFNSSTSNTFKETKTREEESATRHEKQGVFGKTTYKSVTTITEHYWDYTVSWAVSAYIGNDVDNPLMLLSRTGSHIIMTRSKEPLNPLKEKQAFDPIDVEITWLLEALRTDGSGCVDFSINPADPLCHTPRRNEEVAAILTWGTATMTRWCHSVARRVQKNYKDGYVTLLPRGVEKPNFSVIEGKVFLPVALMLALEENDSPDAVSPAKTFSLDDFNAIMHQQQLQMKEHIDSMDAVLPEDGVITTAEGAMVACAAYSAKLWQQYQAAVQSVEDLLMSQLIAAIGKRIGPNDFAKYMDYHNRQLFLPEYAPKGYCYAVRRPDHYPEGTLSIEDGSDDQPVRTTCLHRPQGHTMKFTLNAATEVSFTGEHYVHSVVFHKFSNSAPPSLNLIARARQFSSFLLMLGSLSAADEFQPTHALIIQNKDELKIPLLMETIPAPKEFRDAIESLSPEQQAFCKAYRKMQLAGSLFAVAVVQIKPQLERLLNLPNDSLTKEVKLCQDLMSLFIEYQIPSDLLAYSGTDTASNGAKVKAVKDYVAAIQEMLDQAKEEELRQAKKEMKKAAYERGPPAPPRSVSAALDIFGGPPPPAGSVAAVNDCFGAFGAATGGGMAAPPPPSAFNFSAAPPAAPQPQQAFAQLQQQQQQQPQEPQEQESEPKSQDQLVDNRAESSGSVSAGKDVVDYTRLPAKLDSNFDKFDKFGALRATKIKLGELWHKTSQNGLLSKPQTNAVGKDAQRKERSRAFDLLDALSKSGALVLSGCTLHVVVAATHCFDLDLLNTVVQDNINPIDRVEASGLIMASTIFGAHPSELVRDGERERISDAQLSDLPPSDTNE
mmetsp:Transcript_37204/g.54779  ORF Transcript_37204/g.54779 Transcript_37204/m.54779 type:complete len:923 (+) Transcript_37204:98-2866(+)|eukprot:CAMPEP_0195525622 /NCGR_PEP_ID=MMETSP0794_2-20130614/26131_1 /TAXON_ID=515487 /ORGANISM="Stephanopyxis turris, Strain CCMP 815" /LENGTH=922 /DNA_ID=CAMNT_0040656113 /DNA_START=28 /DNA_END=2796 /DNA_ORIENTATION=-